MSFIKLLKSKKNDSFSEKENIENDEYVLKEIVYKKITNTEEIQRRKINEELIKRYQIKISNN